MSNDSTPVSSPIAENIRTVRDELYMLTCSPSPSALRLCDLVGKLSWIAGQVEWLEERVKPNTALDNNQKTA